MAKFETFEIDSNKPEISPTLAPAIQEQTIIEEAPVFKEPEATPVPSFLQLQENLNNCLRIIDDEVMKGYITRIDEMPMVPLDRDYLEHLDPVQFFKITELVYQENEFAPFKLAAVFSTLKNKPCTLSLLIKSDGQNNDIYLGVRTLDERYSSGTMRTMLESTLRGQFPGTRIEQSTDIGLEKDLDKANVKCISSVTGIADFKQSKDRVDDTNFIQGLEKFINGMKGRAFTALFIAEDLDHDELTEIRREYESIYTQISPFANVQYSFTNTSGGSTSKTVSKGESSSNTEGTNESLTTNEATTVTDTEGHSKAKGQTETSGTSDTTGHGTTDSSSSSQAKSTSVAEGHTESESVAKTRGSSSSGGLSLIVNLSHSRNKSKTKTKTTSDSNTVTTGFTKTDTVSQSISQTLTHGISESKALSETDTDSTSKSTGVTSGKASQVGSSKATTVGVNFMNSDTLAETFGQTQGITLNSKNMALNNTLQKIEKHLKRIDDCESVGMWNFSAFFLGESSAEAESAAYMYQSVVMGDNSNIETSAVNTWHLPVAGDNQDEEKLKIEKFRNIYESLQYFTNPQFFYDGFSYDVSRKIIVEPTSRVSTSELALHMGLPRHSVKGLPVTEHASFAQEVILTKERDNKEEKEKPLIDLGTIYHLGEATNTEVHLDLNSLAMHTFITGSTGSGKSNAVYHILDEVQKNGIPFLVIEPAKGEYHKVFRETHYFGTNPALGKLLQLNPFAFPEQVQILEHIDRLVEIFNVCWPMYAAMPAVLKESIERAYRNAGWDMKTSKNRISTQLFPTFEDVLRELDSTIKESEYSQDTKGDYIGSLSTRLRSLTNGINGEIFVGNEMSLKELFDESAVVDLSHVGAMETKALIMGIIVLKLQEYRVANANEMNSPLKHITVLEEAHNILKKTSTEQSQDSSNVQGKSVEMLTNTIAEIRTYGEGFIIVDQAPNLLDTSVIRNTNTKIVLRLPEEGDREATGKAMALDDDQIDEVAKLHTGVAAVYQNDWQEAVLCKLPFYEIEKNVEIKDESFEQTSDERDDVLHLLISKELSEESIKELKDKVLQMDIAAKIRRDIIQNVENKNRIYEWAVADYINKFYVFNSAFRGTQKGSWDNFEQLTEIVTENLRSEFQDFSDEELHRILYYICRVMHEKHPENTVIEDLRQNYLRSEVY